MKVIEGSTRDLSRTVRALKLKEARDLIADDAHWTIGVYSRPLSDGEGLAYCALGAIKAAVHNVAWLYAADELEDDLEHTMYADEKSAGSSLTEYNDTHSHAEVLALFDTTIARLEATT